MKKLIVIIFSFLVFQGTAKAQIVSGKISGTISGVPAPGIPLRVSIMDTFGLIMHTDSISTNAAGYYESNYSFTAPSPATGTVIVKFTNCVTLVIDSSGWDTSLVGLNPVRNFNYCPTISCNASFNFSNTGLNVVFTNTSTHSISGGIVHHWKFGDGDTVNLKNPTHLYPASGSYYVCLTIYDTTGLCTSTFCDSITINSIPTGIILSGSVSASGSGTGPGLVYLISDDSAGILNIIDSTTINDTAGYEYVFPVMEGTYYVKAAMLPGNSNFSNYLPTYYGNTLSWSTSTAIIVTSVNSIGNNIEIEVGNKSTGPGSIGGTVYEGVGKAAPGDPYPRASIILTDESGNGVEHTLSGTNGEFEFTNLAYGTYNIFVEIIGKTAHSRRVVLSATNEHEENANFYVESDDVTTGWYTAENAITNNFYPNPVSSEVKLDIELKSPEKLQLVITDMAGRHVGNLFYNLPAGKQQIRMNMTGLQSGAYLMHITGKEINFAAKIFKN